MRIKVYPVKAKSRTFYRLKWKNAATGKWVYESTKHVRSRDAQRAAKEREDELNSRNPRGDGSTTWDIAVDRYRDEHHSGNAQSTWTRCGGILAAFQGRAEVGTIADATASKISGYVGKLRKDGLSEQTIGAHLRHLKAFLNWTVWQGMLPACPRFPPIKRASGSRVSRGRPLTDAEFAKLEKAATDPELAAFLRGIWLSGLRLSEARRATWGPSEFQVDLSGERPYYRIWSGAEKGRETRLLAMTPDAAEFFQTRSARSGPVFDLGNLSDSTISHRVAKLAKAAGVFVHDSRGQERPAGCHDLRRSFGERWAQRVPPLVLMELMRHADIKTTLAYYVTADARRTSDLVWQFGANLGATDGNDKPTTK